MRATKVPTRMGWLHVNSRPVLEQSAATEVTTRRRKGRLKTNMEESQYIISWIGIVLKIRYVILMKHLKSYRIKWSRNSWIIESVEDNLVYMIVIVLTVQVKVKERQIVSTKPSLLISHMKERNMINLGNMKKLYRRRRNSGLREKDRIQMRLSSSLCCHSLRIKMMRKGLSQQLDL